MKPVSYVSQSNRLPDQLREVLRYKHYSLRTEEADVYWVTFLSVGTPATHKLVSRVTWARRRCICFLYREVLGAQLPWLDDVKRPTRPRRIPSVLTSAEVAALFGAMTGGELLGHSDVSTTMMDAHVLKVAAGGTASPLDVLSRSCLPAAPPPTRVSC